MKLLQISLKAVKTCTYDISIQCSDNLSMQGINRTLLSWLKLWDMWYLPLVYGKV